MYELLLRFGEKVIGTTKILHLLHIGCFFQHTSGGGFKGIARRVPGAWVQTWTQTWAQTWAQTQTMIQINKEALTREREQGATSGKMNTLFLLKYSGTLQRTEITTR